MTQLSFELQQQLANHFNTLLVVDDIEHQADLVLELVNDTQLLAWPAFRAEVCGTATLSEQEYLDAASRVLSQHSFAPKWVPKMLELHSCA